MYDLLIPLLPKLYLIALVAVVWLLHLLVKRMHLQARSGYVMVLVGSLLSLFITPVVFVYAEGHFVLSTIVFIVFLMATVINIEYLWWHAKPARWLRGLLIALLVMLHFVAWFFYLISNADWNMS